LSQNPTSQPIPTPEESPVTVVNEALKPFSDKVTLIVSASINRVELESAGVTFANRDAHIGLFTGTLDEIFKLIDDCSLPPTDVKIIGKNGVTADFFIEPPKYCLKLDGFNYVGGNVSNSVVRFKTGNYIIPMPT